MEKVIISADSTCDLSKEILEKYKINTFPLIVMLGDDEHLDGVNVTPDDIYEFVAKTKKLPKTAARNVQDYKTFFEKELKENDGDAIVHFTISSDESMSYQNAYNASKELKNVYVVDSRVLSTGIGLLVLRACDLKEEGKTAKEIFDEVSGLCKKTQVSFVVDVLDYLHKGGRCSLLALLGAKALHIHPYIKMKNGSLGVFKKYRGNMKICFTKYVEQLAEDYPNPEKKRCIITHSGCTDELVAHVKELVESKFNFDEILTTIAGSTITSHCGRGTLGVLFINDTEIV